jgi:hypothetical protein
LLSSSRKAVCLCAKLQLWTSVDGLESWDLTRTMVQRDDPSHQPFGRHVEVDREVIISKRNK